MNTNKGIDSGVIRYSTWAGRPSAVGCSGAYLYITGLEPIPVKFVSNNVRWIPEKGFITLKNSKTDVVCASVDTVSDFVSGCTIPAGLPAPGCELIVDRKWSCGTGTGSKAEKMYLSTTTSTLGTAFSAGQQYATNSLNTTANSSTLTGSIIHFADSSANSQFSLGAGATNIVPYANVTNATTTSSIETQSAACYVNLCMAKGVTGDVVTLKAFRVTLKF